MGISTRTEYAIRALLDLALAREGTVVKTADVADRARHIGYPGAMGLPSRDADGHTR